jgi:hypothetical protein
MNMNEISFDADEETKSYCLEIANEMTKILKITMSEAIGRINNQWDKNREFISSGLIFHQDIHSWAKTIYYEDGTFWWVEDWVAENTLKPKPYP